MALGGQQSVVERVKAALVQRGMNLHGACGAFEITKRVAWELRAQGAGLLQKTVGNQCVGYAVDIIAFQDGSYVDAVIDGGGRNEPAWNIKSDRVDPSRWRAAFDPGDAPLPPPVPPPPPARPPGADEADDLAQVIDDATDRILTGLGELVTAIDRLHDRAGEIQREGVRVRLR